MAGDTELKEAQELIAMVEAKRGAQAKGQNPGKASGKKKAGAKPQRRAKRPRTLTGDEEEHSRKPARAKKPAANKTPKKPRKPKAEPKAKAQPEPPAREDSLVSLAKVAQVGRAVGLGGWLVISGAMLLLALTVHAWNNAPIVSGNCAITQVGDKVPKQVLAKWVRAFPAYETLLRNPDAGVIDAFASYLRRQPAVMSVNRVGVEYRPVSRAGLTDGPGASRRVVAVDVTLAKPLLPTVLSDGSKAWAAEGGRILPGVFEGPEDKPLLLGVERGGRDAMDEILAVWPALEAQLPKGLVTAIHLDRPLPATADLGIEFRTRPGVKVIWGAPGEDRFGLTRDEKVRNLVHTITCQGDLSRLTEINVRFAGPFAVLPR